MEDVFGQRSHPAYSSYSHIGDVQNLSFAVGLREDEANAELYVQKILPLCKIVPGKPVERRKRVATPSVDLIEVPEIVEMRARLLTIQRGNEQLEEEHESLTAKLKEAVANLETVEKRATALDDEVDQLTEQLMEERKRSLVAAQDAEAIKQCHADLCDQVQKAETNFAKLDAELATKKKQLVALEARSDLDMVFGAQTNDAPDKDDILSALEVTNLDKWPHIPPPIVDPFLGGLDMRIAEYRSRHRRAVFQEQGL